MRMIAILFLTASLSITSAYAQDDKKREEHPDPVVTSFKQAYAGYNEVAKTKDHHLTTYYARRAYELGQEKFGYDHKNTIKLATNWLIAYNTHSRGHDAPGTQLSKTFSDMEKVAEGDPATLMDLDLAYATYLIDSRDTSDKNKALKYYKKVLKTAKDYYGSDENSLAYLKLDIAPRLYSGQYNKIAKKYLLEAKEVLAKDPEKNSTAIALSNFWLAKSYLTSKKHAKAAKAMSLALKVFDEVAPTGHYTLTGHAFMIQILEKQGKRDEATKHCQIIGNIQPIDVNREQVPLYRFSPQYPRSALVRRTEGNVIIEFTVDEQGFVKNPKAIDGENMKLFSKSALKAVADYRFAPRFENGEPVSTDSLEYRFVFQMAK